MPTIKSLIGHVLVGVPGYGKSTFAQAWITRSPEYVWISTDRIRETELRLSNVSPAVSEYGKSQKNLTRDSRVGISHNIRSYRA